MKQVTTCLITAIVASGFTLWMTDRAAQNTLMAAVASQQLQVAELRPPDVFNRDGLTDTEAVASFVYEKNNRSVVNITTRARRQDMLFMREQADGAGSGIVLDKRGHILTNFHVVEEARKIEVTLFNGKTIAAKPVGADPVNDTAVLKIDAPAAELFPVSFGDSSKLKVGMQAFAIGNPFGYDRTLTTGTISSLNRSLQIAAARSIKSIIQVDAAINPGNSGGPLFNARGQLIGMNTAIATRTGQSAGVGFAIPANLLQRIVPILLRDGRIVRPEIGVQSVYETEAGLLIQQLTVGGPAARAGLRGPRTIRERRGPFIVSRTDRTAADLIVGIDGRQVKSVEEFLAYIDTRKPGDEVLLSVVREDRKLSIPVVLIADGDSK